MKKKLSPYQRIMAAAKNGVGIRLSADEVWALSIDPMIEAVALDEDDNDAQPNAVKP